MQSTVKLTFKFYIQTGSAQQQLNVCHYKMHESKLERQQCSVLFELSC